MNALRTATPIVISAIALIISIVTYLGSITAANITLSVGEWMEVFHDKDQALFIHLPLVFQNTGARTGVIRSLGLVLRDPETKEAIFLKWEGFLKPEEREGGGWVYESTLTPAAVPGKGEITKMAEFYGRGSVAGWLPKPIEYEVYLLAWVSDSRRPSAKYSVKWTFTENDVSEVKVNFDNVRTGGSIKGRYVFRSGNAPDSTKLSPSQFNELVGYSE